MKHKVVKGLKKEDFIIEENGVKKTVTECVYNKKSKTYDIKYK